ncbi:MAG: DUF3592 domain-containing protein [Phycisphaerales bacterium]|nr:MAG: DUF3592 domain-containing protein [Phycisphaerales bacterium]
MLAGDTELRMGKVIVDNNEAREVLEQNRSGASDSQDCPLPLFWVVFLLFTLVVLVMSASPMVGAAERLFRAGSYQQTTGVIEDSGVEIKFDTDGMSSTLGYATYTYEVGGRAFRSGRVSHLGVPLSTARSRWFSETYAPGETVTVHYDPRWPSRSVLLTDVALGEAIVAVAIFGAIWGLIVTLGAVLFVHSVKRAKAVSLGPA